MLLTVALTFSPNKWVTVAKKNCSQYQRFGDQLSKIGVCLRNFCLPPGLNLRLSWWRLKLFSSPLLDPDLFIQLLSQHLYLDVLKGHQVQLVQMISMISSTSSRSSSSVPSSQQTASAIQMYKLVTEELPSSLLPLYSQTIHHSVSAILLVKCCKDPFLSLHLDLHLIQVAIVFQLDLCSRLLTDLPVSSFLFHPSSNQ